MSVTVIDVHSLLKVYHGKAVINHIVLSVNPGEIYVFLGSNGSGKTITMSLLCGLLTPRSGGGSCLGYDIVKQA